MMKLSAARSLRIFAKECGQTQPRAVRNSIIVSIQLSVAPYRKHFYSSSWLIHPPDQTKKIVTNVAKGTAGNTVAFIRYQIHGRILIRQPRPAEII